MKKINDEKFFESIGAKLAMFFSRPELVFATIAAVFGFASIFIMPMQLAPDETVHFRRAFQLSEGAFLPNSAVLNEDRDSWNPAYSVPIDVADFHEESNATVFTKHTSAYLLASDFDRDIFVNKVDFGDRKDMVVSSAEPYFPIAHLPQAIGILAGRLIYPSIGVMYLFGRLFNLIFYTVAMFFIIKAAKRARWVYVVVALFPMLLCHAASFSADSIAAVGIFGLAMMTHNLFIKKEKISRRDILWLMSFALLAAFIRPTNVVLLLPLCFLPKRLFKPNKNEKVPFNIQKWTLLVGCGIVLMVMVMTWQIASSRMIGNATYTPYGVDAAAQIKGIISNPIGFIKMISRTFLFQYDQTSSTYSMFRYIYESPGAITWLYIPLPSAVFVMLYAVLLLAFLNKGSSSDSDKADGLEATVSLATYMIVLTATATALYVIWTPVGPDHRVVEGLQGRYFTPMFIFLAPMFLWLQKHICVKTKHEWMMGIFVSCAAIIALSVCFAQIMKVYAS